MIFPRRRTLLDVALVGVEGTGSYGAGLTRYLTAHGVRVVEVDRANRHRNGRSDPLNAVSAARAALSGRASGARHRNPGVRLAGSFCWPPRARGGRLIAVTEQSSGDVVPGRWNAVGPKSNMWMDPAQDPRFAAGTELEGERATLLDYLRAYRLGLELKCAGLNAEQLARRSVPPSTMSLLGLVRHMADVERNWFRRVMAQADAPPLYWSDDVEDADWAGAVADPAVVAAAWRAWREEVAFAEQFVADSPDLAVRSPMQDGTTVALREVILHMVEEYARHLGHADLLRERIDGRIGQ